MALNFRLECRTKERKNEKDRKKNTNQTYKRWKKKKHQKHRLCHCRNEKRKEIERKNRPKILGDKSVSQSVSTGFRYFFSFSTEKNTRLRKSQQKK